MRHTKRTRTILGLLLLTSLTLVVLSLRGGGGAARDSASGFFGPIENAASAVVRPELSGPEPRTSTSMPKSVAVTWMSSGLSVGFKISAIAQAAAMAPSRPTLRIGQRSMATM